MQGGTNPVRNQLTQLRCTEEEGELVLGCVCPASLGLWLGILRDALASSKRDRPLLYIHSLLAFYFSGVCPDVLVGRKKGGYFTEGGRAECLACAWHQRVPCSPWQHCMATAATLQEPPGIPHHLIQSFHFPGLTQARQCVPLTGQATVVRLHASSVAFSSPSLGKLGAGKLPEQPWPAPPPEERYLFFYITLLHPNISGRHRPTLFRFARCSLQHCSPDCSSHQPAAWESSRGRMEKAAGVFQTFQCNSHAKQQKPFWL